MANLHSGKLLEYSVEQCTVVVAVMKSTVSTFLYDMYIHIHVHVHVYRQLKYCKISIGAILLDKIEKKQMYLDKIKGIVSYPFTDVYLSYPKC